MKLGKVYLTI